MSTRHSWQKKLVEKGKANRRKRDGVKKPFATDGWRIEFDRPQVSFGKRRAFHGSTVRAWACV